MKKKLLVSLVCFIFITNVNGQFKVRDDSFVQISYENTGALSFGQEINTYNNGKYAIEYYNSGLNFWKPWPTANSANYILFLRDDNNVGISTSGSSSYRLDIAGYARSYGWYTISDERLKSDIQPITNSIDIVNQLEGVTYNYSFSNNTYEESLNEQITTQLNEIKENTINSDSAEVISSEGHIGFIAQDVKEIIPNAVIEDENGILSINYIEIIPLLVEALKEQQTIIEGLENNIIDIQNSLNIGLKNSTIINNEEGSLENTNKTILYNNIPNPYNNSTIIKYFLIDEDVEKNGYIYIYNQNGVNIDTIQIQTTEKTGQIEVYANNYSNGVYSYSLVVNSEVKDTKSMIISK